MVCGNENVQSILDNVLNEIFNGTKVSTRFLVLEGPKNIGKTTIVKQLAQKYLGTFYNTDFLYIADLSDYLGKNHAIKVEVDEKEMYIEIPGEGNFVDMGTRQLIGWLSRTTFGKYKILLLENIERMTTSAANAFLKTFEESNPNNIIIATTTNKNLLLDTIVSRAFILKFEIPSHQTVIDCLKKVYIDMDLQKLDVVTSFSMNRIGFAKRLLEGSLGGKNYDDIIGYFERFIRLFEQDGFYHEKMDILTSVMKAGFLEVFLDALIFYYNKERKIEQAEKILKTVRKLDSNVGVENLLFEMVI